MDSTPTSRTSIDKAKEIPQIDGDQSVSPRPPSQPSVVNGWQSRSASSLGCGPASGSPLTKHKDWDRLRWRTEKAWSGCRGFPWFLRRLASSGLRHAPLYSNQTFDFHSDRGLLYLVKGYLGSTNRGLGILGASRASCVRGGQAFFLEMCSRTRNEPRQHCFGICSNVLLKMYNVSKCLIVRICGYQPVF